MVVGDWPVDVTGERRNEAPWNEAPWEDARTSVFDPAPVAGTTTTAPTSGDDGDAYQRLTTSDTDPFGARGGSLSARLRDRRDRAEAEAEEDDTPPLDMRLIVGCVVAAVLVLLVGGYVLVTGMGDGDDPAIAVADTAPTTDATTTTTTTATTTTEPATTEATTPTTEAERTTTTRPRTRSTTPPPAPTTTAAPTPPPTTDPPPPTTDPPPHHQPSASQHGP